MSVKLIALYRKVVRHFGSQQKTADALGITQPSVNAWLVGKSQMSPIAAFKVERITNGRFKADELCPKLAVEAA
ncbi:helix-turn-helix domain-containing protein [Acinetobacter sp. 187]|uniref:transcriptional regulator n=1 Tax=Acinetobacter lanii TaxID=2715163 RepID=UPI00140BAB5F|nr:Cro/CI family transcriptional regulator [Acinetobacter lanii]NHC02359.1 helix-turn-helix domain-containing protein [Acinetobacter lanii]